MLYLEKKDKKDWEFVYPDSYHDTMEDLEYAIDLMNRGDFAKAEKEYVGLFTKQPYHLDAYHHMALSRYRQGKLRVAQEFWEHAVEVGRRAFSMDFQLGRDRLPWGWLDNRPFLRSLDGLATVRKETGMFGDALWLYREAMLLNPDDNIGARYHIGEMLLDMGRDREYVSFSDKYSEGYFADLLYGRVLAFYRLGEMKDAEKALRTAKKDLPLVAKELTKKRHTRPDNWNERYISLRGEDQAYAYWQDCGKLWKKADGALEWLREELKGS
jgi:tetratricopeptide (TPR) repeat protein